MTFVVLESERIMRMDYIKRDNVKKEILSWAVLINHPELLSRDDALCCIDSIAAANVTEVKHGKWNKTTSDYECSNCEYPMDYITPFCPNCGARMDYETEKV